MNTSTNYHMNRAIELKAAEDLRYVISADTRRENIIWGIAVALVTLAGLGLMWMRTIGAGGLAGISSFVVLGLMVLSAGFAVWFRNR